MTSSEELAQRVMAAAAVKSIMENIAGTAMAMEAASMFSTARKLQKVMASLDEALTELLPGTVEKTAPAPKPM